MRVPCFLFETVPRSDECRGVRGLPYTSFLYVPLERWSDFIIHKDPSSALDRCLGMEEVSYGAHVWAHAIRYYRGERVTRNRGV